MQTWECSCRQFDVSRRICAIENLAPRIAEFDAPAIVCQLDRIQQEGERRKPRSGSRTEAEPFGTGHPDVV
jgi:hypothetical protein